jgi:DNA-binding response OmpR family regulator
MAKILFVEDDKDLTEMVNDWLSADGYSVEIVNDGTEGWEVLRNGQVRFNHSRLALTWWPFWA